MMDLLEPLRSTNLRDVFVERLEGLILSGALPIGERLPPERALAERLGVSRPVVHEGLVELAARGLVTMRPRVGTVVNDYRRQGSLALLGSLVNHAHGDFAPPLLDGMLGLRRLVQGDAVRLATLNRSAGDLADLDAIVAREARVDHGDVDAVVELDLAFHHAVALASGNPVYPMLVRSFEPAERNLASRFFAEPAVAADVFARHRRIVAAITTRNAPEAVALMEELLDRGRETLMGILARRHARS
jgi:GntR family transcriptional repressor for pyruvate dehydrogenase complex